MVMFSCFTLQGLVLAVIVACAGCTIQNGITTNARYEKNEEISSALAGGSLLSVMTHNGFIKVAGGTTEICTVKATIRAFAPTRDEAAAIAEKTHVKFVTSGRKIEVVLDAPTLGMNRSVCADYTITVPRKTSLTLQTHNGAVGVDGIAEQVEVMTHNGAIEARNVAGDVRLESHNGRIFVAYAKDAPPKACVVASYNSAVTCEELKGSLEAAAHNGAIQARYAAEAPGACNVNIAAYNGNISLVTPRALSARVEVTTHAGNVSTGLPIPVTGRISKSMAGTIGKGEGRITLAAHSGSITVK